MLEKIRMDIESVTDWITRFVSTIITKAMFVLYVDLMYKTRQGIIPFPGIFLNLRLLISTILLIRETMNG